METVDEFFDRYLAAYNQGDRKAYASFLAPPVLLIHSPQSHLSQEYFTLWEDPVWFEYPENWSRTSVDSLESVNSVRPFAPRAELTGNGEIRETVIALLTRWDRDDKPLEQIQALYFLVGEPAARKVKGIAVLAVAGPTR
jgi:hypothetical protein